MLVMMHALPVIAKRREGRYVFALQGTQLSVNM